MAWRGEHPDADRSQGELVPIAEEEVRAPDAARLAHPGPAAGTLPQPPGPGDVIGVDVGLERVPEGQTELGEQLEVAIDLVADRIDQGRLERLPIGDQVGVGAGLRVEELSEDHGVPPGWGKGRMGPASVPYITDSI
jgi:hypothetical protein